MDGREIRITPESVAGLRTLLNATANQGGESFVKGFREHCKQHGWNWFGMEPRKHFNWYAMQFFGAASICRFLNLKRSFEVAVNRFWVFRADIDCPDEHRQLDGLVLSPDHEFWQFYTPPLAWDCGCRISRTDRLSMVHRLGGNPDKPVPKWWTQIDAETQLRPGIEEPWAEPEPPSLLLLLAAIVEGHAPPPPV